MMRRNTSITLTALSLSVAHSLPGCATNMAAPKDGQVLVKNEINVGAGATGSAVVGVIPTYGQPVGQAPVYQAPMGPAPQAGVIINTNIPAGGPATSIGGQLPVYQQPIPIPVVTPTPVVGPVTGVKYASVNEVTVGSNRFLRVIYYLYNKVTRTNFPYGWLGATLVPYDETFTAFLVTWSGTTVRGLTQTYNATQMMIDFDITTIPVNSTNANFHLVQAPVSQGQVPPAGVPQIWFNEDDVDFIGRILKIVDPTDPAKKTMRL